MLRMIGWAIFRITFHLFEIGVVLMAFYLTDGRML